MGEYEDECYCDHCQKYTPHVCRDSGHERDSSQDYRRCKVCDWYRYGYDGKYHPPLRLTP